MNLPLLRFPSFLPSLIQHGFQVLHFPSHLQRTHVFLARLPRSPRRILLGRVHPVARAFPLAPIRPKTSPFESKTKKKTKIEKTKWGPEGEILPTRDRNPFLGGLRQADLSLSVSLSCARGSLFLLLFLEELSVPLDEDGTDRTRGAILRGCRNRRRIDRKGNGRMAQESWTSFVREGKDASKSKRFPVKRNVCSRMVHSPRRDGSFPVPWCGARLPASNQRIIGSMWNFIPRSTIVASRSPKEPGERCDPNAEMQISQNPGQSATHPEGRCVRTKRRGARPSTVVPRTVAHCRWMLPSCRIRRK